MRLSRLPKKEPTTTRRRILLDCSLLGVVFVWFGICVFVALEDESRCLGQENTHRTREAKVKLHAWKFCPLLSGIAERGDWANATCY